ncbi:GNAT family N-acetyltransferase [Nesterenkonia sp.]|uniref:GNAT family N-acetyltransferase n=1 Tax=Nesterenkonia sp. TaxID=704201 RepID=UPI00261CBB5F|nr:GNAT family N-acetyltransferase [Nesterenkonia sp.]
MRRNTPQRRTEMWAELLAAPAPESERRIVVAERDSRIIGFGAFGKARDDDAPTRHELWRLYVLAESYGTGLAHRLLDALDPGRTPSYLWVMEANQRAIAFYRKHGYRPDGAVEHLPHIGNLPKIRMVRR